MPSAATRRSSLRRAAGRDGPPGLSGPSQPLASLSGRPSRIHVDALQGPGSLDGRRGRRGTRSPPRVIHVSESALPDSSRRRAPPLSSPVRVPAVGGRVAARSGPSGRIRADPSPPILAKALGVNRARQ
ncbi:hypothetical protein KM043_003350 [Ampulex compressa]|nr:hypothetical protein KM043_003350 [Ampulex compressa]